jgi:hypothetical protein
MDPSSGRVTTALSVHGTTVNYNLLYNERNDQLLLRQYDRLCCIKLDGHVIHRYDISGCDGLAVDQQGHVYISGLYSDDTTISCYLSYTRSICI